LERITEAFVWPVRDPEWVTKLLLVALIQLIPIVGAINNIGWMLASIDRLRAGEEKLAPANLSYLARGARVFVVELIYALILVAVGLVIYLPGLAIAIHQNQGGSNAVLIAVAILLNLVAFGVITLGSLALTFMLPAVILTTDTGGIAAGLRIGDVLRRCRLNPINTLIAGLMLIAASFVGSLGVIACGIGAFFTAAYALAMQAWIFRSFEIGSTTPKVG
jgi:CDP-diglyceride synthetase